MNYKIIIYIVFLSIIFQSCKDSFGLDENVAVEYQDDDVQEDLDYATEFSFSIFDLKYLNLEPTPQYDWSHYYRMNDGEATLKEDNNSFLMSINNLIIDRLDVGRLLDGDRKDSVQSISFSVDSIRIDLYNQSIKNGVFVNQSLDYDVSLIVLNTEGQKYVLESDEIDFFVSYKRHNNNNFLEFQFTILINNEQVESAGVLVIANIFFDTLNDL